MRKEQQICFNGDDRQYEHLLSIAKCTDQTLDEVLNDAIDEYIQRCSNNEVLIDERVNVLEAKVACLRDHLTTLAFERHRTRR